MERQGRHLWALLLFAVLGAGPAVAHDEWDLAGDSDDTAGATDNTLWHTSRAQRHDLESSGVADEDWYRIHPREGRSYEVQVTNVTGDADIWVTGNVARYNSSGTIKLQDAVALDSGNWIQTIRWEALGDSEERIHVTNGSFSSGSYSNYDIKLYDTTLYCPRWNNARSQITVFIVQHAQTVDSFGDCYYVLRWYDASGTELAYRYNSFGRFNQVDLFNTAAITGLPGFSGSATISGTCGYGGLQAKAVALEPSTGFSFDTPCNYLPQ